LALHLLVPDRFAVWVDRHIGVGKASNTSHSTEILQESEHVFLLVWNTHVLEGTVLHHEHDDMLDIPKPNSIGGASKRQQ
jgi:hypothetical protein